MIADDAFSAALDKPEAAWEQIDGAQLLDRVEAFLVRFVAYPSDAARVAHVLWVAHTHLMGAWESTPRIAFLSPEPGSGKSRALEVTELLVPRPVHAVNTSPAYLFRKVSDEAGPPTLLYDEIDTVFGPKAKDNEDIRGMLNAGHRRGAVSGRCVIRGKTVDTEELPAYCAVALAGLDDLPDTIATRSVIVRMRRRAPHEHVEPFRHRLNAAEGHLLRDRLADWAESVEPIVAGAWPEMPDGIEDRNADVWEALLAVADAAGGAWPERARCAAVTVVTEISPDRGSLGIRLLADLRDAFADADSDKLATGQVLDYLTSLDEAPWGDLRGKPLDARGLSRRLAKYGVTPRSLRIGLDVFKGYERGDLLDVWSRYLAAPSVTGVTDVTEESPARGGAVTDERTVLPSDSGIDQQLETWVTDDPPLSEDSSVTSVTAVTPVQRHTSEDVDPPASLLSLPAVERDDEPHRQPPTVRATSVPSCVHCGQDLKVDDPDRTVCARCQYLRVAS